MMLRALSGCCLVLLMAISASTEEKRPPEGDPRPARPRDEKPPAEVSGPQRRPAGEYRALRAPIFGLSIELNRAVGVHRLVSQDERGAREVLREGTLAECETRLIETLEKRHGRGLPNVPFPTMGGKQFWADELLYCGWRIQENVYTGHYRLLDPGDLRLAWGTFEACRVALERVRIERRMRPRSDHLVVLVHGLFRSKDSFADMAEALEKAGYEVASINYPSTRRRIEDHAEQLERILENLEGVQKVSFVTHSLGGIVVRALLARDGRWKKKLEVGRLVMIGPPSRGSIVAEQLKDWFPYRVAAGDSGQELTSQEVEKIPVPSCPFGIIAGGKGDGDGYNPLLPGDDDGTVTVESTKLPGAAGFLLVEALHSFLMKDPEVIQATRRFLEKGEF
ncbi:MAG: alpha/beta fold hydrolase [Planctomycetes bacterium]|nr:alpha/beta fold hydrolase [Planctomycetota bacterium]